MQHGPFDFHNHEDRRDPTSPAHHSITSFSDALAELPSRNLIQ
jgi:hypothetical protein